MVLLPAETQPCSLHVIQAASSLPSKAPHMPQALPGRSQPAAQTCRATPATCGAIRPIPSTSRWRASTLANPAPRMAGKGSRVRWQPSASHCCSGSSTRCCSCRNVRPCGRAAQMLGRRWQRRRRRQAVARSGVQVLLAAIAHGCSSAGPRHVPLREAAGWQVGGAVRLLRGQCLALSVVSTRAAPATPTSCAMVCSMNRKLPPGRSTRRTCCSTASISGTEHSTCRAAQCKGCYHSTPQHIVHSRHSGRPCWFTAGRRAQPHDWPLEPAASAPPAPPRTAAAETSTEGRPSLPSSLAPPERLHSPPPSLPPPGQLTSVHTTACTDWSGSGSASAVPSTHPSRSSGHPSRSALRRR